MFVQIDWGRDPGYWLGRCLVSGARAVSEEEVRDFRYDSDAVVPTEPRAATLGELEQHAAALTCPPSHVVEFTRFAEGQLRLLPTLEPRARGMEFELSPGLKATFGNVEEFPPRGLTTTPNRAPRTDGGPPTLGGIHVDNEFLKLDLEDGAPPRRLGVCLGPGDHYLILAFALGGAARIATTPDVRSFVARGGELSCLWIRLTPGDAYAAPVGLIPHVGGAYGVDQSCRMAFLLGHWERGALPLTVP